MTLVGALGAPMHATVDALGTVQPLDARISIGWWVGDNDLWRQPTPTTTRAADLSAPLVQTTMRVAGGDAIARVYGVGGPSSALVLEFENDSPGPVVLALVVQFTERRDPVRVHDSSLRIGDLAMQFSTRPRRRAVADSPDALFAAVKSGGAADIDDAGLGDGGDCLHEALLFAVPHGTRWRAVLGDSDATAPLPDPRAIPSFEECRNGWARALDRGLRIDVPDERLQASVDRARASALLRSARGARHDAGLCAVLEDWGFDREAAHLWSQLSWRARRRARRRPTVVAEPWLAVRRVVAEEHADSEPELLESVRSVMITDHQDEIQLAPHVPVDWFGAPFGVTDAPTRRGPVSYAVRWHGDRPALLWDAPPGVPLRAPALDTGWCGSGGRGEALLAAPAHRMLGLRSHGSAAGRSVTEPGSFS